MAPALVTNRPSKPPLVPKIKLPFSSEDQAEGGLMGAPSMHPTLMASPRTMPQSQPSPRSSKLGLFAKVLSPRSRLTPRALPQSQPSPRMLPRLKDVTERLRPKGRSSVYSVRPVSDFENQNLPVDSCSHSCEEELKTNKQQNSIMDTLRAAASARDAWSSPRQEEALRNSLQQVDPQKEPFSATSCTKTQDSNQDSSMARSPLRNKDASQEARCLARSPLHKVSEGEDSKENCTPKKSIQKSAIPRSPLQEINRQQDLVASPSASCPVATQRAHCPQAASPPVSCPVATQRAHCPQVAGSGDSTPRKASWLAQKLGKHFSKKTMTSGRMPEGVTGDNLPISASDQQKEVNEGEESGCKAGEESGCKACENAEAVAPLAAMRSSQQLDADLPTWILHGAETDEGHGSQESTKPEAVEDVDAMVRAHEMWSMVSWTGCQNQESTDSEALRRSSNIRHSRVVTVSKELLSIVYQREVEETVAAASLSEFPEVAWLADCVLQCPTSACWYCMEDSTGIVHFQHAYTKETKTSHPLLAHFAALVGIALRLRVDPANVMNELQKAGQALTQDTSAVHKAWTGPYQTDTGSNYWFCPSLNWSSWTDPLEAPGYLRKVFNDLHALLTGPGGLYDGASDASAELAQVGADIAGMMRKSSARRSSAASATVDKPQYSTYSRSLTEKPLSGEYRTYTPRQSMMQLPRSYKSGMHSRSASSHASEHVDLSSPPRSPPNTRRSEVPLSSRPESPPNTRRSEAPPRMCLPPAPVP